MALEIIKELKQTVSFFAEKEKLGMAFAAAIQKHCDAKLAYNDGRLEATVKTPDNVENLKEELVKMAPEKHFRLEQVAHNGKKTTFIFRDLPPR